MEQESANNIYELASSFALRIVNLYKFLTEEKKEYIRIDLLHRADYLDDKQYDSLFQDWNHVYAVLVKIVKATKPQILKLPSK